MATYNVAAGERAAHDKTLTADTVDTVTFARSIERVEVISDGTDDVWVTIDGTEPTVAGATTFKLPASSGVVVREIRASGFTSVTEVKLLSEGTPVYSVTELA